MKKLSSIFFAFLVLFSFMKVSAMDFEISNENHCFSITIPDDEDGKAELRNRLLNQCGLSLSFMQIPSLRQVEDVNQKMAHSMTILVKILSAGSGMPEGHVLPHVMTCAQVFGASLIDYVISMLDFLGLLVL